MTFPDREIYKENEGILLYQSKTLESLWGKGFCTLGDLTFETAAYTARYILKKINGDQQYDHYQTTCVHTGNLINLEPEYTTMSRKPGIGLNWVRKYSTDIWPHDFLVHNNATVKVPRYYDNQLTEEALIQIKKTRITNAKKQAKNNTPERLAVREKIKLLNLKQLTRSYENYDT